MKASYFSFFLMIFLLSACARKDGALSYKNWRKMNAKESIQIVHDGFLAVRLKTMNQSIEALRERNRIEEAERLIGKVEERNRLIAQSFEANYDFSPVYFFYSGDSRLIKEGFLDSVVWMDSELQPVLLSDCHTQICLVADFGTLEPDTAAYRLGYREDFSGDSAKFKTTYYSNTNFGIPALLIRSQELVQLTDPFPYYVRTFESLPIKRTVPKAVRKLNKRFFAYYRRS